jgi:hypothetical protein
VVKETALAFGVRRIPALLAAWHRKGELKAPECGALQTLRTFVAAASVARFRPKLNTVEPGKALFI